MFRFVVLFGFYLKALQRVRANFKAGKRKEETIGRFV